jgi:hypothetical protein
MSPFKSIKGRALGKLLEGYKSSDIGKGFGSDDGGGAVDEDGTVSKPFTSITNAYSANVSNGMYYFQNSGVNSGIVFQLRFASYDNRGWVETFYSLDNSTSTPWDHFLTYVGGAARPTLTNFNLSGGGLDYSSISGAVVLLGTGFNIVDVAITSKSSKTGNGVDATGQNQQSALPLVAYRDLAGTEAALARQRLADFFEGSATGFSIGGNVGGTPTEDYAAYWSKSGANPTGPFEMHLGYREGNKSTEEFHLADGNNAAGSTFAPNIGWRTGGQSYSQSNLGSWSSSSSGKDAVYTIDSGNVLSIWLSDTL